MTALPPRLWGLAAALVAGSGVMYYYYFSHCKKERVAQLTDAEDNADAAETAAVESLLHKATFAAGCFWGVELAFQRVQGVITTTVGYTQGHTTDPTYPEVKAGNTGHVEAVQVEFDPQVVTYQELLDVFWNREKVGGKFDPSLKDRQGNDKGSQYRSGIYYHNELQKAAAEASKQAANKQLTKPWQRLHVEILAAKTFYKAEDNHQQYLSDKGGRKGVSQSAAKGSCNRIRCYG